MFHIIPELLIPLSIRTETVVDWDAPVYHRFGYLYLRLRFVELRRLYDDERYIQIAVELPILRQWKRV